MAEVTSKFLAVAGPHSWTDRLDIALLIPKASARTSSLPAPHPCPHPAPGVIMGPGPHHGHCWPQPAQPRSASHRAFVEMNAGSPTPSPQFLSGVSPCLSVSVCPSSSVRLFLSVPPSCLSFLATVLLSLSQGSQGPGRREVTALLCHPLPPFLRPVSLGLGWWGLPTGPPAPGTVPDPRGHQAPPPCPEHGQLWPCSRSLPALGSPV